MPQNTSLDSKRRSSNFFFLPWPSFKTLNSPPVLSAFRLTHFQTTIITLLSLILGVEETYLLFSLQICCCWPGRKTKAAPQMRFPMTGSSSYPPLDFPGPQDFRVDKTPLHKWCGQIHPAFGSLGCCQLCWEWFLSGLSHSYVDGSVLGYTLYSFCWGPSEPRPYSLVLSLFQAVGFNLICAYKNSDG